MIEVIVALIGAGLGLAVLQYFNKYLADKNQVKLEAEVKVIESRASKIEGAIKERDKKTKEEVDAITKEQEKPITTDNLVDFFNQRKGG